MVKCVTLIDYIVKKKGYTFHHQNYPPFNFFRMCNHFYIGLYKKTREDLWNRMAIYGCYSPVVFSMNELKLQNCSLHFISK